ncbi:MAG: RNA-binding cell elongation regulator Jag/EloR [Muricoprocola sp.]
MEEFITVTAKTVKDAILEASLKLETFRDNIEYEVIDEGSTGFLGFGSRKAVIKARKKVVIEDILKEEPVKEVKKEKKEFKKDFKKEKKEVKKDFKKEKKEVKEVKEPVKAAVEEPVKEEKQQAAEVVEEVKKPVEAQVVVSETESEEVEKKERKLAELKPEEIVEVKEKATKFLKDVFATIDMEIGITSDYEEGVLNLELTGEDMGVLIGKRGQTLDSLQYLTSLVVNKGRSGYIRVKVDTENYRSRRKETLENLAKNIAFKVKRTKRPVFLEPMNPYERRIIHSALQNDPYVTTHSEGEEPYRKVVVTLKRGNKKQQKERQ